MKYLATNEIGFDAASLGFPSVKTCQAIVYETTVGLFGFHDALSNATIFTRRCDSFRQFVQGYAINHATQSRSIIGVITREQRFYKTTESVAAWKAQLVEVATVLGFTGDIWGVRLEEHVGKDDSTYMRFDVAPVRCKVSYKRWKKMDFEDRDLPKDVTTHALLKPVSFEGMLSFDDRPFARTEPTERNRPVVRRGKTTEGNLNVVQDKDFVKFR